MEIAGIQYWNLSHLRPILPARALLLLHYLQGMMREVHRHIGLLDEGLVVFCFAKEFFMTTWQNERDKESTPDLSLFELFVAELRRSVRF